MYPGLTLVCVSKPRISLRSIPGYFANCINSLNGKLSAIAPPKPAHQSAANQNHCFALGCASNQPRHFLVSVVFMARLAAENVVTIARVAQNNWQQWQHANQQERQTAAICCCLVNGKVKRHNPRINIDRDA